MATGEQPEREELREGTVVSGMEKKRRTNPTRSAISLKDGAGARKRWRNEALGFSVLKKGVVSSLLGRRPDEREGIPKVEGE